MRNLGGQTLQSTLAVKGSIALLVLLLWCQSLPAQGPFYQGKTINLVVGYPAGTTHDIWARMVAQYMPKHLEGAPSFVVQPGPARWYRPTIFMVSPNPTA